MYKRGNDLVLEQDDLVLEWMDICGVQKAHLILFADSDMATSVCGRHFPQKDLIHGDHENSQCKRCLHREQSTIK